MFTILQKQNQYNDAIFNGKFIVNKPVISGAQKLVEPCSNIYYFSHSVAIADCQFPLHGHSGFEIITFIIEGDIEHFDTETKKWTPLSAGDFQIIQAGEGVQHSEKLLKGSRAFQIWFDPNFAKTLYQKPTYKDYKAIDFPTQIIDGISTINYIGNDAPSNSITEGLEIKKLILKNDFQGNLPLNSDAIYWLYILNGESEIEGNLLQKDDAIKIETLEFMSINCKNHCEIFIVKVPAKLSYRSIYQRQQKIY